MKTAVVTGVAGQDGSYLAEHLVEKGYFVIGVDRRRPNDPRAPSRVNLESVKNNQALKIVDGDITDPIFIITDSGKNNFPLQSLQSFI